MMGISLGMNAIAFLGPAGPAGALDVPPSDAKPAPAPRPATPWQERHRRLSVSLERGYGVQYWGEGYSAPGLARAPHGLLIVEATRIGAPDSGTGREVLFTPEEVRAITHGGDRPVLAYLNLAKVERYRDYWQDLQRQLVGGADVPPSSYVWLGPVGPGGDQLARYWLPAWQALLLQRVDRLMALGFDGVFLDDVLQYYVWGKDHAAPAQAGEGAPRTTPEFARAMMDLVGRVADHVHAQDCNALVVVNNGVFIGRDAAGPAETPADRRRFDSYARAIDGLMIENAFADDASGHTAKVIVQDFSARGIQVMSIDFTSQFAGSPPDEAAAILAARAAASGFHPYVTRDGAFNRLDAPMAPRPVAARAR